MKRSIVVLGLIGLCTHAMAAVDAAITTAITEAGADALTVISAVTVAAALLMAGFWVFRVINRAK